MSGIDYRVLLRKYIDHVVAREGADFIADWHREGSAPDVQFTNEEWAELQKVADEEAAGE